MAVTPRTFFQPFAAAVFNGVHNFATDTLRIALTNIEPDAAYSNFSSISQIAPGGGYSTGGFAITTTSSTQGSGVYKLILQDYTLSATGTIAEWRYAVLYNDTAAGDPLILWYTFARPFSLTSGNTFLFDFDGANGVLNFAPGGAAGGSVSVAVSPSSVAEDGTPDLVFTFTRTGVITAPLTVNYTIGGTAVNGTDYATIGTTATFGIGSATTTVTVNPTTDATIESDETVILTVATGSGYTVGSPSSATGTINNDDSIPDPDFASVSLLLLLDGADGSTTFTDSSGSPKTITAIGNAQVDTAQSKFGGASAYFDGTGDYLDSATLITYTGVYTIEAFIRVESSFASRGIVSGRTQTNGAVFRTTDAGANRLQFLNPSLTAYTSTGAMSLNTWHHVALTRNASNTVTFWIDGVASGTVAGQTGSHAWKFVGWAGSAGEFMRGWIDAVRLTGVCRYTASFTPPSAPFPTS